MSNHLKQIAIICVSFWLLSSIMINPSEALVSMNNQQHQIAETDINRVNWKLNHMENPGFEFWSTDHSIDDISTTRTTERFVWYAQSPWPVNEGSRSRGLQSKAVDSGHLSEALMTRSSWVYWDNPVNLTLKFDWYIDQIPQPVDGDYFRIDIELGAPGTHHMYYYFGTSDTYHTNSSSYYQYYFIDGAFQTWNTFDRNITQDFFDLAGYYPTQFRLFRFSLVTYSNDYSRVFLDDLWMTNNTVIIGESTGNGNFETGSGWYSYTNQDPADISRSVEAQEGDWSLNATTMSNGNQSRLAVTWNPDRLVSSANPDAFSLKWMLDEYTLADEDNYGYISVNCENDTEEFNLAYVLCYGDNTNSFTYEGMRVINVTGFNTTGQWYTFSRSIWSDISNWNQTDFVIINEIELNMYSRGKGALTTILLDDMKLVSASLDDMGYEGYGNVGDEILTWGASYGPDPAFTLTNVAHSGARAANLTIADDNSWGRNVYFANRYINDGTDLWLDFFWRIEDDTADEANLLYLEIYFESGESLAYIFANHSEVPMYNGFDEFIIVPNANTVGTWFNFQRNIYDDFVTAFGSEPATKITEMFLYTEADIGGRLESLFDDVYLYTDPAPGIQEIFYTPTLPNVYVNVSAVVYDLSSFTVTLYYKIEDGTWIDVVMEDTGGRFNASIPNQIDGTHVTFYIEAVDAFGQISQSVEIGYLVTSSPEPTPTPSDILPLIAGVVVIIVIVGVIIVYYFVIKPKQSTD